MRRILVGDRAGSIRRSAVVEIEVPRTFRIGSQAGLDARELRVETESATPEPPKAGEVVVTRQLVTTVGLQLGDIAQLVNDRVPEVFRVEPGVGDFQWLVSSYGPDVTTPMHATATLDLQYVVSGEVSLVLDDEEIELVEGDSVIIPGANHAWRTGSVGCTRVGLILGASEPVTRHAD